MPGTNRVNMSPGRGDASEDNHPTMKLSGPVLPSISTLLYFVSIVSPSVLIGFFVLLSIFNQNLKGLAYLVGICVLFALTNTFNAMSSVMNRTDPPDPDKCPAGHAFFSYSGGVSCGTLIYVFSFFYLLMPMWINKIFNIPLLLSLILITIVDGVVNIGNGCTTRSFVAISSVLAMLIGTIWSLVIYEIEPGLAYHTDYITSNKLACSVPSKQNFKCVVKKNGEIIG